MAYRTGGSSQRQLTWFDRSGTARGTVGDPDDGFSSPHVSPDGRRVAVGRAVQGNTDLWFEDMPLAEIPEDADEKRREKSMNAPRRLLEKAQEKYGFHVEPLSAPEALVVENGRVVGLRLRRTKMEGGKLVMTDESFERQGACVISSIGSIPEPIPGIPMKGELFAFTDWEVGRLDGYPNLFSVDNVVTGKGNIVASCKHAAQVYENALASFLGLEEDGHAAEAALPSRAEAGVAQTAGRVATHLAQAEPPSVAGLVTNHFQRIA